MNISDVMNDFKKSLFRKKSDDFIPVNDYLPSREKIKIPDISHLEEENENSQSFAQAMENLPASKKVLVAVVLAGIVVGTVYGVKTKIATGNYTMKFSLRQIPVIGQYIKDKDYKMAASPKQPPLSPSTVKAPPPGKHTAQPAGTEAKNNAPDPVVTAKVGVFPVNPFIDISESNEPHGVGKTASGAHVPPVPTPSVPGGVPGGAPEKNRKVSGTHKKPNEIVGITAGSNGNNIAIMGDGQVVEIGDNIGSGEIAYIGENKITLDNGNEITFDGQIK